MSYTNFVQLKLAAAATAVQTTLVVTTPAAPFAVPAANGSLTLLDIPDAPTKAEIVTYTTVTNNGDGTHTLGGVVRAQEGTAAQAWAVGAGVFQSLTAAQYAADLGAKEPSIAVGAASQMWLGNKTWASVLSQVQGALLTGYSVGANAVLAATDNIMGALQKLQGQLNNKLGLTGGTLTGPLYGTRVGMTGSGNDYNSGAYEASGNGAANTVFPTVGFHQPSAYAASLQLRGATDFRFYAQGAGSYANVTAANFYGAACSLSGRASVGDVLSQGWLRTLGVTGWFNETYGGGIYMQDATYVRTYNGKSFLCNDAIQIEGVTPQIRLVDTEWGTRYLYADSGNIGFLSSAGGWTARFTNDGFIESNAGIRFGEFSRGLLQHVIDGGNNRIINLTNWDGGGVSFLHAPNVLQSFCPQSDGGINCGWVYGRWSSLWSTSGAIQTSDAREKTAVRPLNTNELAAAKQIAAEIGVYQWLEAVEKKGESARLHPGQTVQHIIAIMQSHDLDPFSYGFICYDEWPAVPVVYEEDGETVKVEGRESGNRYSMRYDELNVFMAHGLAQRQNELEARISALEGRP